MCRKCQWKPMKTIAFHDRPWTALIFYSWLTIKSPVWVHAGLLSASLSLSLSRSASLAPWLCLARRLSLSLSLSRSLSRSAPPTDSSTAFPQALGICHSWLPHVATLPAMRMSRHNPHCISNMRIHATLHFEHANTCICFFTRSIDKTPAGGNQRSSTHQARTELRSIT